MDAELRQNEIEPCEKSYYEEQYQRIRECEQEPGYNIFPHSGCMGGVLSLLKGAGGILSEKIDAENSKDDSTEHLKQESVGFDELGDEAKTKTGEKAIHQITQGSADTGEKSRPAPLAESTLNHQHPYRTHWSRYKDADSNTTWQYIEQLFQIAVANGEYIVSISPDLPTHH